VNAIGWSVIARIVRFLGDGADGAERTRRYDRVVTTTSDVPRANASADGEGVATEQKAPLATRLVLARHAVTEQTGPMLSGRTPGIDLSEAGRRQADALGERFAALPVSAVYASPIERTTQTAQAIATRHGLDVQALPGVLEADYGEWTGQQLSDLAKTDLWKVVQRTPSRASFPGGESLSAMQARMIAALDAVVVDHAGALVVVVSHADPIKAAIAHYTGVHLDLFQRIVVSPASVTAFEFGPHGVAMLKCNDTGALDELRPPDEKAASEPEQEPST
jgi:probable phosphoglycerate mutase